MDSHDIKSAVHGRTRAVLPHTKGGEPKARTLRGLCKHVRFTVNYANTCSSDATIYLPAVILPLLSGCHKRYFVGGKGFPLAQRSFLFINLIVQRTCTLYEEEETVIDQSVVECSQYRVQCAHGK